MQNDYYFYFAESTSTTTSTCRVLSCHATCSAAVQKALHIKTIVLLLNNFILKPTTHSYCLYTIKTHICGGRQAFLCTFCSQLSSLCLHSAGAPNPDSFHDSASSTVYSDGPLIVSVQMFEESYGKTDEGTDGVKEQIKQAEKPFVMPLLNTSDVDPSQGEETCCGLNE